MKYVAKQRPFEIEEKPEEPALATDFDVEQLLMQGGEILRREIKNLLMESSSKKLSAASSRDLVAYIQLLSKISMDQKEIAESMTDEELLELANKPK